MLSIGVGLAAVALWMPAQPIASPQSQDRPRTIANRAYSLDVPRPTDLTVSGDAGSREFTFVLRPGAHISSERVRERSEVAFFDHLYQGDVVSQHFLVDVDGEPTVEPRVIIGQWHGAETSGRGPWLEWSITNNRHLQLRVQSYPGDGKSKSLKRVILYKAPFQRGKWYDVRMEFRPGPLGIGFLDAWVDGIPVAHYRGTLGYMDEKNFGFFKFGAYRWVPGKTTIVVRYRNVGFDIDRSAETRKTETWRRKSS